MESLSVCFPISEYTLCCQSIFLSSGPSVCDLYQVTGPGPVCDLCQVRRTGWNRAVYAICRGESVLLLEFPGPSCNRNYCGVVLALLPVLSRSNSSCNNCRKQYYLDQETQRTTLNVNKRIHRGYVGVVHATRTVTGCVIQLSCSL